jgi:putative phage-type endonuclease
MQAINLIHTANLGREEWLEFRKQGIGGSDAAAVAGLSRWKSPMGVWLEKTGQVESEPSGEAAYWGTMMEPIIREEFTLRTGMNVRQVNSILQHRKFPYMLANIDGIVTDPVKGEGVFEAKTAGLYSTAEWEKGLPDEYAIQVQHYLAVTGLNFAYIAVLIGGNRFIWKYIERDEAAIDLLIQLEARFWKLVQNNTPPPIDGSKASTELLGRLYPHGEKTELQLPPDTIALFEAYDEAREQEEAAHLLKETTANLLKDLLGKHEKGTVGDRSVHWLEVNTERLDTKLFKAEEPELHAKYLKPSSYRRFQIK